MKVTILLTSLVLSPAVWAELAPSRDSDRAVVWVDELKSLKDKDAVTQSRLAQAAQKLDKIRMDLAPRYVQISEEAQKEFARLRNEANLDQYVPMVWEDDNSLQKYVLKSWNSFQAEKPDFSYKQNSLLKYVSELVDRVRLKHLQGIHEKRAQMLLKKMGEADDVYDVALNIKYSINDAKDHGITTDLIAAQEKAKRIGYSLPPGLIQDIEVAGARTYTYWKISTLVRDHNKRAWRDHSGDLEKIRRHSRIGGLDVSSALAKIQDCVKRDILCEVQASDITDAGVKMRAATEKINSVFENLPQNFF